MIEFDPKLYKFGQLFEIEIKGRNCKYNYTGMISLLTNLPHGFGRAIDTDFDRFFDG